VQFPCLSSFEISMSVNFKPPTPHLRFGYSTHTGPVNFHPSIPSFGNSTAILSIQALTSCRREPHFNPRPATRVDNTAAGEPRAVAEAAAMANTRIRDWLLKHRMCRRLQMTLMMIR
jgi:hypothetical protein